MAQNDTPKKALVLAGGGARGSYQVGADRAGLAAPDHHRDQRRKFEWRDVRAGLI